MSKNWFWLEITNFDYRSVFNAFSLISRWKLRSQWRPEQPTTTSITNGFPAPPSRTPQDPTRPALGSARPRSPRRAPTRIPSNFKLTTSEIIPGPEHELRPGDLVFEDEENETENQNESTPTTNSASNFSLRDFYDSLCSSNTVYPRSLNLIISDFCSRIVQQPQILKFFWIAPLHLVFIISR